MTSMFSWAGLMSDIYFKVGIQSDIKVQAGFASDSSRFRLDLCQTLKLSWKKIRLTMKLKLKLGISMTYVYQEMLGASWVEIVITREGSSFGVGNYQTGV